MLNPRSVALVGASPKPGTVQRSIVQMVRTSRLMGPLFAVNPNYPEVEGIPCYPSIGALPAPLTLSSWGLAPRVWKPRWMMPLPVARGRQ